MKKLIIASYNIHKCVGIDKKFAPDRIIQVIKELDADILALQETDKRFGNKVGLLDLEHLKNETNFSYVPIQATTMHGHGWHGNAIFIKHKQALGIKILDILQIHLPGVEPRGALFLEVLFPFGPLRIIAAHFGLLGHSRYLQGKAIISILKERPFMPTIMLGDLNEWRYGEKTALHVFKKFFDLSSQTPPSFPSRYPLFPLDRIFCCAPAYLESVKAHDSQLARIASDHLPLKAVLCLPSP